MYLFDRYICFYSNLFGFETKKIIPFHEVTAVRRAMAAAIFPTAIEIIAGEKKYFFTSFLSRDEAFKLIGDGWLRHSSRANLIADQQDSIPEISSPENLSAVVNQRQGSQPLVEEIDFVERDKDSALFDVSDAPINLELEIPSSSGLQEKTDKEVEIIQRTECPPCKPSLFWKLEDYDAPNVPEGYTLVAESKFPIEVEEFFDLFFSDAAANFQESFHKKCGDREFHCSSWSPHETFGHTRDISFQHPIKVYFGARCGSCQEVQKYRVYKNSHLILDTSQEISDVPYGDYFRVEGLWDVEQHGESNKGCILRVYTNVAFSKKTMFKGKIVQSTVEECREAYALWIELAHEVLKRNSLEQDALGPPTSSDLNNQVHLERHTEVEECSKVLHDVKDLRTSTDLPDRMTNNSRDSFPSGPSIVSSFIDSMPKFGTLLRGQSQVFVLTVVTIAIILLLMQMSILVLLSRPQQIHIIPQGDFMNKRNGGDAETAAVLDRQITHLKEEMVMVETLLDKMRQEHALLKIKLKDLDFRRKIQT
ncbi:hypothetical protein Leryth_025141 [Lithospermum erythrorhizon]|nr:hypothetical protein Leryth_025141 [Lithospermum erythrorhizon]